MFGLRGQELLIILFLLAGLVFLIWLVVFVIKNATRQPNVIKDAPQQTRVASATDGPTNVKVTPTNSAEQRLAELDSLRESGLLSVEEYEAKRKEILDSI